MTAGPSYRQLVVAQTDEDWARWRAEHPGVTTAARVVSVSQARRMGAYDPAGWVVTIAGHPADDWLGPIMAALSQQGFAVTGVWKGGYPYR